MASEQRSDWLIVLTQATTVHQTVWRMHDFGLELYVPLVREKRSLPKKDKHGRKIIVMKPRPMFPGYGFLREDGVTDITRLSEEVRGVHGSLQINGGTAYLSDAAVMAIRRKEYEEHQRFMEGIGGRRSNFKPGDRVRIDDDGSRLYDDMLFEIEKLDGNDRFARLKGRMKLKVNVDRLVAA